MRRQDESKKSVILAFIDEYYNEYNEIPAVRTIAEGTGIALATVYRYLLSLKESGELEYNGRKSISTKRIDLESRHASAPVLGYVRCGEGEEETEEVIEYIRLPESLVGTGEFFVLIAKGDSMIDTGVNEGDYVVIRKQNTANDGEDSQNARGMVQDREHPRTNHFDGIMGAGTSTHPKPKASEQARKNADIRRTSQMCGLRMGTSLYAQSPHGKIQGTKVVHLYAVQRVRQG